MRRSYFKHVYYPEFAVRTENAYSEGFFNTAAQFFFFHACIGGIFLISYGLFLYWMPRSVKPGLMPDEDRVYSKQANGLLQAINLKREAVDDIGRRMRLGYGEVPFFYFKGDPTMRLLQQRGFKWELPIHDSSTNIKNGINYIGKN
eukprot:TRINITY_DN3790_c0_g1_i16.p3 TRINITY_DN3790_c0_g1~~TRINITY_DN3790_c0_g1_i16.p3  ORF type:complete len:146 (+),score=22.65 TRINITY_DN3790_c0_g1_i16:258-695(+)